MRCPRCNSIVGDNWNSCSYCGYDLVRFKKEVLHTDSIPPTIYSSGHNTQFINYQMAYEQEKQKMESYRKSIYLTVLLVSLILNIVQLIVIIILNL